MLHVIERHQGERLVSTMKKARFKSSEGFIRDAVQKSITLRSKSAEFYGLQRELAQAQVRISTDYMNSKDIKHPRDVGAARENILKTFLQQSGLLPKKFGISSTSARVVSPTGHYSKELDIVLYDELENIVLMRRHGAIDYYPRESVFGTIQVKSKLGKTEIQEGFSNVASFKMLYEDTRGYSGLIRTRVPSTKGFGVIFAYDSDLEWTKLISLIEESAQVYEKSRWPNFICVLSKGIFLFGTRERAFYHNAELTQIDELQMHGRPDRDGSCLFYFYSLLMDLLSNTAATSPQIDAYYNLPHTAGELSYSFEMGIFGEVGTCDKHGDYLRKISVANLAKVIAFCRPEKPLNWIEAIDIAYEKPRNEAAYQRQPADVFIYNPENISLSDILISKDRPGLMFDAINTAGMQIWIPFYYSIKETLVEGCPKCSREAASNAKLKLRE